MLAVAMVLACLCFSATAAEIPAKPQPGKDVTVQIPGNGGSMVVFLPSNYTADRKWPAIFHYHGMSGQPTTSHLRPFTHDRDFIIVGMPYLDDASKPRTPDEQKVVFAREFQNYSNARTWLMSNTQVDAARVFMSGVSRGGWTTSILGEMDILNIAGMVNLLAGRMTPAIPPPAGVSGKPVYVAAGETDPNLVHAMAAADTYRRNGAITTFEEYTGVGHAVPANAPGLESWLACHGRLRDPSNAKTSAVEVAQWFDSQYKTAAAEANPARKAQLLRDLTEDSRAIWFPPPGRKLAMDELAALRSKPPVKNEWDAETSFGNCLLKENSVRSLPEMKDALDAFTATAGQYPGTKFGKVAATHAASLSKAYEQSAEASRKAMEQAKKNAKPPASKPINATFPTTGSAGTTRGPAKSTGNKLTFGP
jgi:predicted esterase